MWLINVILPLLVTYYAAAEPDLHRWFEGLRSDTGGYCCAEADGFKVDDPNWGKDETGYWVVLDGQKIPVPPGTVIHAKHSKVNYAVVWRIHEGGKPVIRCFLPGTET